MAQPSDDAPLIDLLAGLLFLALGIGGTALASTYTLGTIGRMGPGFFPLVVSASLALIGAALCLRNGLILYRQGVPALILPGLRVGALAFLIVLSSLIIFAILIEEAGLAVTAAASIAVAYVGSVRILGRRGGLIEGIVVTLGLSVFVVVVFIHGIGLPFRTWPW